MRSPPATGNSLGHSGVKLFWASTSNEAMACFERVMAGLLWPENKSTRHVLSLQERFIYLGFSQYMTYLFDPLDCAPPLFRRTAHATWRLPPHRRPVRAVLLPRGRRTEAAAEQARRRTLRRPLGAAGCGGEWRRAGPEPHGCRGASARE